ncbi:MAG: MOSC domain-containing protein [Pleurocapsa sp.]
MIVSELYVYPIKSCQGIKLKQAEVLPKGFLWDREMMLVTKKGKFLTQRQFPRLAQVQVKIVKEKITLSLEDNSITPLTFTPTLKGTTIEVYIWQDTTVAIDQGNAVARWFHRVLQLDENKECRLVRQSAQHIRSVKTSEPVSFADNFPFMITATASLEELNQRIVEIRQQSTQAIPMNRFRPNIVVKTEIPFVEDNWRMIQIGSVKFFVVKPSSRCIITTIDQQQGEKNQYKEPLSTLGTFRQFSEQGVMFGENMIPRNTGMIKIGDRVKTIQLREPK